MSGKKIVDPSSFGVRMVFSIHIQFENQKKKNLLRPQIITRQIVGENAVPARKM